MTGTSGVRLGVVTPVLTRLPWAHAAWERGAGFDAVVAIARAADRLGYHHLTCSEHVAVPLHRTDRMGATYWDPLAVFGYLAACTDRIRFATHVLVLGYHHPLAVAKRYGTLDRVSGGRLVLGVGVGYVREEFELLGVPFDDRGARADDALRALRASLSTSEPEYDGSFHRYRGVVVDPCAAQAHVPIWVGGRTARSLRRAIALADGWVPYGLPEAAIAALLEGVTTPPGFDVVVTGDHPLDPLGEPGRTVLALEGLAALGATVVNVRFAHESAAHFVEQLSALRELVPDSVVARP